MPNSGESGELLARYEAGDAEAAARIFERYSARLLALVQTRLSAQLARRIDADDVVQSACRSFFVHAGAGEFTVQREGDLWRLLATITLHKLRRQARHHRAAKRALGRESNPDPSASEPISQLASREPLPADAAATEEELAWLLKHFEPEQQRALNLRIQGLALAEIGTALGRSEKTVRRWLADAQALLAQRLRDQVQDEGKTSSRGNGFRFRHPDAVAPLDYAQYHLTRLIGSGGMSKVYVATERSTGRQVAFKVLRKRLQRQPRFIDRFLKEAQIVARLQHPSIVPLHGLGRLPDGGYFMVLDYIDGANAAALARTEGCSSERAATIVAAVAEAIHAAHEAGVIHRDLKPANVLLDASGRVFVTDFGFAWTADELSGNGSFVIGTSGFMAPEQYDPTRGPIGPHTDVWGLGALLYALVNSTPPYASEEQGQPMAIPVALQAICGRCLASNWQNRYTSARDVAQALTGWLQNR